MNGVDILTRDLAPMRHAPRFATFWWVRKGTESPISGDELALIRAGQEREEP